MSVRIDRQTDSDVSCPDELYRPPQDGQVAVELFSEGRLFWQRLLFDRQDDDNTDYGTRGCQPQQAHRDMWCFRCSRMSKVLGIQE